MIRRFFRLLLVLLCSVAFSRRLAASGQCLPEQSAALLRLKQGFTPPARRNGSSILPSWKEGTDCCRGWAGVTCEGASGSVVALDLSGSSISGGVDKALFDLTSLRSLDLACNNLNFSTIPSPSFERLTNLTHLNLSDSGISGSLPVGISRLTSLVSLDLSTPGRCSSSSLTLQDPDLPTLIRNLSNLRQLYLDGVNISAGGRDWGRALSSYVPNLHELSLSGCSLSGPIDDSFSALKSLVVLRLNQNNLNTEVPEFFGDLSLLRLLRLNACGLRGSLPRRIFQLPFLETLDLTRNPSLSGSLPDFPPGTVLEDLVLSATNLSGALPDSIGNLRLLKTLQLTSCRFSGPLPASFQNLTRLVTVDLSMNNFSGPIPSFASSPNISKIDLQNNSLSGPLPGWIFSLRSLQSLQLNSNRLYGTLPELPPPADSVLEALDLTSNRLQGPVPRSISRLQHLKILKLASNNFNGTVELSLFGNLKNLSILDLSYNRLTVQTNPAAALPNVSTLNLAFCSLEGFPSLLKDLPRLNRLDLSGNNISGAIPDWLWSVGSLDYLNLSHNSLTEFESSPDFSNSSLIILDLHSNSLEGPIPRPPPSNVVVDFSNNHFNSSIPSDIGSTLNFTIFFSVSNNSLTGGIPESVCSGIYLQVLDLSHNSLAGQIPGCLFAGEMNLHVLNLRGNNLSGTLPRTFEAGCKLRSLNLNGNMLEGAVPPSLSSCRSLEVLDLGNNQIEDAFPFWLGNLSELRVLVLRSNKFYGPLPRPRDGNYTFAMLQIMDISSNRFNGTLPSECFKSWKAMTTPGELPGRKTVVAFKFLTRMYYVDTVTVTSKGQDLALVKILTIFTSIDLSNNDFQGSIPPAVGDLKALRILNMSQNRLSGPIPPSIGGLTMLESLDLSKNKLSGEIPTELVRLSFLSFLNLSFNQLVGGIPVGGQLSTFGQDTFEGNEGLCGPPLPGGCSNATAAGNDIGGGASNSTAEYSWKLIFVGLGYGGGLALVFGPFVLLGEGRRWYNEHVDRKLLAILPPALVLLFDFCRDAKVDSADCAEDVPFTEWDEGGDRRFCVFCTRLEFREQKVVIHHVRCSCALKEC